MSYSGFAISQVPNHIRDNVTRPCDARYSRLAVFGSIYRPTNRGMMEFTPYGPNTEEVADNHGNREARLGPDGRHKRASDCSRGS